MLASRLPTGCSGLQVTDALHCQVVDHRPAPGRDVRGECLVSRPDQLQVGQRAKVGSYLALALTGESGQRECARKGAAAMPVGALGEAHQDAEALSRHVGGLLERPQHGFEAHGAPRKVASACSVLPATDTHRLLSLLYLCDLPYDQNTTRPVA